MYTVTERFIVVGAFFKIDFHFVDYDLLLENPLLFRPAQLGWLWVNLLLTAASLFDLELNSFAAE